MLSLDNIFGFSSIISGDWKFINGTTHNGVFDGFLGENDDLKLSDDVYANAILSSRIGKALADQNDKQSKRHKLMKDKIITLRETATTFCNTAINPIVECNPLRAPCLFNIITDPCERTNLAAKNPSILSYFRRKMNYLVKTSAPVRRTFFSDPKSNPSLHNDTWDSWIPDEAY